jgi:hypothetical protein
MESKFKTLTADIISVEKKGEDSTTEKNYCNVIINTNNARDIKLKSDERKLICLKLSTRPLNVSMTPHEIQTLSDFFTYNDFSGTIEAQEFASFILQYGYLEGTHRATRYNTPTQNMLYRVALSNASLKGFESLYLDILKNGTVEFDIKTLIGYFTEKKTKGHKASSSHIIELLNAHMLFNYERHTVKPYLYKDPIKFGDWEDVKGLFVLAGGIKEYVEKYKDALIRSNTVDENSITPMTDFSMFNSIDQKTQEETNTAQGEETNKDSQEIPKNEEYVDFDPDFEDFSDNWDNKKDIDNIDLREFKKRRSNRLNKRIKYTPIPEPVKYTLPDILKSSTVLDDENDEIDNEEF